MDIGVAIAMIKNIFLHILIILSSLCNTSFATDNNFNSASVYKQYYNKIEDKKQTNEYGNKQKNKKKIDYVPLKINFNKNEVQEVYERWQKYNTGTYVYISMPTFADTFKAIHFVQKNAIIKYVKINNLNDINIQDTNNLQVSKENIFSLVSTDSEDYLIDNIFKKALKKLAKVSKYDCFEYSLMFNKNYNYIAALTLGKVQKYDYISKRKYFVPCKSRLKPLVIGKNGMNQYIYGLMMLPNNTQFTDDTMRIILNKYKQAWECEKKLLAAKRINNEQNLTMLEKAVGKEKLQCLDKYLVWDENVSK